MKLKKQKLVTLGRFENREMVLKRTTLVKGNKNLGPEWEALQNEYESVESKLEENVVTLLNACLTQRRLAFALSRRTTQELIRNDENSSSGFSADRWTVLLAAILDEREGFVRKVGKSGKDKAWGFEVRKDTPIGAFLYSVLQVDPAEQVAQVVEFISPDTKIETQNETLSETLSETVFETQIGPSTVVPKNLSNTGSMYKTADSASLVATPTLVEEEMTAEPPVLADRSNTGDTKKTEQTVPTPSSAPPLPQCAIGNTPAWIKQLADKPCSLDGIPRRSRYRRLAEGSGSSAFPEEFADAYYEASRIAWGKSCELASYLVSRQLEAQGDDYAEAVYELAIALERKYPKKALAFFQAAEEQGFLPSFISNLKSKGVTDFLRNIVEAAIRYGTVSPNRLKALQQSA